jgi:hypothetical protein
MLEGSHVQKLLAGKSMFHQFCHHWNYHTEKILPFTIFPMNLSDSEWRGQCPVSEFMARDLGGLIRIESRSSGETLSVPRSSVFSTRLSLGDFSRELLPAYVGRRILPMRGMEVRRFLHIHDAIRAPGCSDHPDRTIRE